jgi:hypothetical protein
MPEKETLMLTSFNGDYKGYFVERNEFLNYAEYETRAMNFFGARYQGLSRMALT